MQLKQPTTPNRSDQEIDSRTYLLGHYAGFISRFLAMIIDLLLVVISWISITWFVSVTTTILQFRSYLGLSINQIPGSTGIIEAIFGPIVGSLLSLFYFSFYFVFFWTLIGKTPGKALLGIRVVTYHGGRISVPKAIIRFLGYFISAICLGVGFFWVLVDDRRQGFHDKIARTLVVYTWEARPDEKFLAEAIREIDSTSKLSSFPAPEKTNPRTTEEK